MGMKKARLGKKREARKKTRLMGERRNYSKFVGLMKKRTKKEQEAFQKEVQEHMEVERKGT
jgi:hypothetical protein